MLDKLFDKLPYEVLEKVKLAHLLLGAVVVGGLVLLGYYFTLYSASLTEYDDMVQKKGQLETQLKKANTLVAQTDAITKQFTTVTGQFHESLRQMPALDKLPKLMKRIHQYEQDLSVELASFELLEGSVKDYYKEIPLYLKIKGEFWNTVGFLDGMQDLLRVLAVDDLTMEQKRSGGKYVVVTELHSRTFAFIEGTEKKKAQPKKKK